MFNVHVASFEAMQWCLDFGLGTMPDDEADSGSGAREGPDRSREETKGGIQVCYNVLKYVEVR